VKIALRGQWYLNTQIGDISGDRPTRCNHSPDVLDRRPGIGPCLCVCSRELRECTPNATHFFRCALTREHREELNRRDIEHPAWK